MLSQAHAPRLEVRLVARLLQAFGITPLLPVRTMGRSQGDSDHNRLNCMCSSERNAPLCSGHNVHVAARVFHKQKIIVDDYNTI